MAKWMWIIAGPNGAGKSTLTASLLDQPNFTNLRKLNADERTAALRRRHPRVSLDELNLRAAQQIDAEVVDGIERGHSFLVETVLSSDKYHDDVLAAKAAGFNIGLIYISLHPPELSPLRVSERVMKGGHAVDAAKAVARYTRSHAQLTWFAARADALFVYDNSAVDGMPVLIASRATATAALIIHQRGLNPAVDRALAAIRKRRALTRRRPRSRR